MSDPRAGTEIEGHGEDADRALRETDAEVTPVENVADPVAQLLAAPRSPSEAPYSPAKDRERMRNFLGSAVFIATGSAATALLVNAALKGGSAAVFTTVFTAFIGLSGTVLGFYFGGKDNTS
jgi:ferric-dicitrate binding protein FerR (iron transport regulator)